MENKWQHFVPQFYFRLFSQDNKTINLYNLKREKHCNGPLSKQSAKDYFYSKNIEFEKNFSSLERKFNNVLKKISETSSFSNLESEDYKELLRFISFQHERTEHSKRLFEDLVDKMSDKVMKPLMKSDKELMKKVSEKDIDEAKLSYPSGFLIGVIASLESNILLADLVPILILNQTELDFIFSDNPVVFHNLIYYRSKDDPLNGIQSPGLLVFCPISPKHCVLLFDPEYYNINSEKDTLEIDNEQDVIDINKLQIHNSLANLYYGHEKNKSQIDSISKNFFFKYSKGEELSQIREFKNWDGSKNSLLVSSGRGIPERIKFSFLTCGNAKRTSPVIRNAKLFELFKEKVNRYLFNNRKP